MGGGGWGLKTAEILLAESCREQVSFESGFKQRKVEEFLRSDGRELQTEGASNLKERSPNVLVLCFGTLRSFSHDERRFRVSLYAQSEKDNVVESLQKSGGQKWLSCAVVGI